MLEVKSTLEQRIKQLMLQNDPGFNALTIDATKQIANVSAVIKKPYDPNIIPEDIGRTRVNILTGNRRVSNGNTAISDRISTTSVAPTADIVGWTTDVVFTASDSDTVAWTSGSIKLADGTSLSINAGNTGNISAVTYVYYNGTTTLQTTTTPQTAVGANKIMVCVAKNSTSPALAQFQAFGTIGNGIFVTADNIAADAVTANAIAANSIDGMTITGALVRTAASGVRSQLSSSYFSSFDANYERIRLGGDGYKLQFRDQYGSDGGYIYGFNNAILGSVIRTSSSFICDGSLIISGNIACSVNPYYDATYSLGTIDNQWTNLYLSDRIYFTRNGGSGDPDGVLNCSFGYPSWRAIFGTANWIPVVNGSTTSGAVAATGRLHIVLGGTVFKLLYNNS